LFKPFCIPHFSFRIRLIMLSELQLPAFLGNHLVWLVALAVVAVGLIGIGRGDVARLSWRRIWAISSVCFAESIRRRVLWITPLTIVGVVIAVQLLQPFDEQDAVRQTVKYSLFATGTLVVMVTIILACTSLPKEIDNRVIYTVVTKPTTRLEIVLGKIVGFARVSATILLIMGVFTLIYAQVRAGSLRANAASRLESLTPGDPARPSLEHYVQYGLLQSKTYARPDEFGTFGRPPRPDDTIRWAMGNDDQSAIVGFDLPPEMFPPGGTEEENGGLVVLARIQAEFYEVKEDWHPTPFPGELPDPTEFKGIELTSRRATPTINVDVLGPDRFNMVPQTELPHQGNVPLARLSEGYQQLLTIPSRSLDRLYQRDVKRIFLRLTGLGPIRYGYARDSIRVFSPRLQRVIDPMKGPDGRFQWPAFRGRETLAGQQLRGGADLNRIGIGVFAFRNATTPAAVQGRVPMELRVGIEGSGEEISSKESVTHAVVEIYNHATGQTTPSMEFPIESNRTAFFTVPPEAVAGGNFDLNLRCLGPGHYLVIRNAATSPSLQVVVGQEPFVLNLIKSLFITWLMSLLVVIVSIFCSTFVSWPIAVVLTVVILLGHWGASQIGESNAPGLGAQIGKDLFGPQSPAATKVVSSTVDNLSRLLNAVAKWLPDISQFAATEDLERGVTIAPRVLIASIKVILVFGVPLTVLAYVFLKNKEVAP
jgi:ABC-type transport system involved in multi-copper enzyme maturation permease subunit